MLGKARKAVEVTVNPQGKVCRIRELAQFFSVEGTLTLKEPGEMDVGGKAVFSRADTLLLDSGALTARRGGRARKFSRDG